MTLPHDDQKYIDALLNNDSIVLAELYKRFSGKIKAMIIKNNGNEDEAADVFQESLIAIYHKAAQGNFVLTCPFEAYLYLICKNKWINELNKKANRRVTNIEDGGYAYSDDSFANAAIVENEYDRKQLLLQQLQELGGSCKEILELSWTGIGMDEVAKKLQNSYGYVRKKKSECMAKLIAMVKNDKRFAQLQW